MRTISAELEALLRSRFQAAGSGYAARFEVDNPAATGSITLVQSASLGRVNTDPVQQITLPAAPTAGNLLVMVQTCRADSTTTDLAGWTLAAGAYSAGIPTNGHVVTMRYRMAGTGESAIIATPIQSNYRDTTVMEFSGVAGFDAVASISAQYGATLTAGPVTPAAASEVLLIAGFGANAGGGAWFPAPSGYTEVRDTGVPDGFQPVYEVCYQIVANPAGSYSTAGTVAFSSEWCAILAAFRASAGTVTTATHQPKRANLNRNLRMGPDQATVELANGAVALGFGPTSIFLTNSRCRLYQWLGDPADAVLTFTGVIDKVDDSRDPLTTVLTCRSMAGPILVDQTFSTTAPQAADESGAVRTEDNGVYLAREVDYVVADRLERAGWPAAQIDIADTTFVLDEFIVDDGASEWDTLARLAAFVGYTLWDDEDGWIHFATIGARASVDDTLVADYEYEIGAA